MKRYLIAAAVALAVFAGAAFAATLNVDGGVVQAGQDLTLSCADNAVVTYGTQTSGDGQFYVNKITVTFDGVCNGYFAYVAPFLSVGPGGSSQTGFGIDQIAGNQVVFTVNPSATNAKVANVNAISVMVKSSDDSGTGCYTSGIITACATP
jgi:hypothetical protein